MKPLKPIHISHQERLSGKTTTKQITKDVLENIQTNESKINAFLTQTSEIALVAAEKADALIQQGKTVKTLEGMPIAVKDILVTKGIKTTCGSKFLDNFIPPYESTVTSKLSQLNYGLVGKTNLDEFAMGSSTENSGYQITRNPYDLERVPGGSSGGSAAALSAGFCMASIGTDTGGSIRQPASFCGNVGLKPTYGRVSRYGIVAYGSSLDQAGGFTQDVEDAAILLESISGYDKMDNTSANVPVDSFTSYLNQDIKGMKIGLVKNIDLKDCDNEVQSRFYESIEILKKGGAEIVEIELNHLDHGIATYYILVTSEASSNLGKFDGIRYGIRAKSKNLQELYAKSRDQGFGSEVKLRILIGTFALSSGYYDAYYLKAEKVRNLIRRNFQRSFEKVDAIAMPVAPTTAFKIGENIDNPLKMYLGDVFTVPANLAGLPGISIPSGKDSQGLPIGFQLLAAPFQEKKLIQIGYWFEKNTNFPKPQLSI